MASLEYNGHAESVCLDEVSITRESLPHPGTGAVIGHRETWSIRATRIGEQAALLVDVAALEEAYAEDGHDLVLKTAPGGTTLASLLTAAAAKGVRIVQRPSFPTLAGAEFVTVRGYTIVAQAEIYDGDPALLYDNQTWSWDTGQDLKTVRTVSGELRTAAGTEASGYFASRAPELPEGYVRGPKRKQVNHDDTAMSYSYTDRELWRSLPNGILEGGYTESLQTTGEGTTLTIAGRFVGPTAWLDIAILQLKRPSLRMISEVVMTEGDAGAKSFTLMYDMTTDNLVELTETVSIGEAYQRQVFHEVLGGGEPVRQQTSLTTSVANVSGRAVGRRAYPAYPEHHFDTGYLADRPLREQGSPRKAADNGDMTFPISWAYRYEFPRTPTRPEPHRQTRV